jgi:CBS domain-containing protein
MSAPLSTPVQQIMSTQIEMVADTVPIAYAARLLVDKHISGLPVTTEEGELVGVLSWVDVMRALGVPAHRTVGVEHGDFYNHSAIPVGDLSPLDSVEGVVGDYMSRRLVATSTEATVGDAARVMARAEVHRALVVDRNGNLAGLLSTLDIVRHIVGEA